jgi:hypothetical protein
MAELIVDDEQLHVKLSRLEKVGAFSGEVSVPLTSITAVERLVNARSAIRGMRFPGTGLPGVIALGRWRKRGSVDFVAVYKNNPGYLIELDGERFDRIVISSDTVPALDNRR